MYPMIDPGERISFIRIKKYLLDLYENRNAGSGSVQIEIAQYINDNNVMIVISQ